MGFIKTYNDLRFKFGPSFASGATNARQKNADLSKKRDATAESAQNAASSITPLCCNLATQFRRHLP